MFATTEILNPNPVFRTRAGPKKSQSRFDARIPAGPENSQSKSGHPHPRRAGKFTIQILVKNVRHNGDLNEKMCTTTGVLMKNVRHNGDSKPKSGFPHPRRPGNFTIQVRCPHSRRPRKFTIQIRPSAPPPARKIHNPNPDLTDCCC